MRPAKRSLLLLLTLPAIPLSVSCLPRPQIEEAYVRPEVVCPGDQVAVRFLLRDAEHAWLTMAPTPVSASTDRVSFAHLRREPYSWDHSYQICDTTEFRFRASSTESEGACSANHMACTIVVASVIRGTEGFRQVLNPCAGSGTGVRAEVTFPDTYAEGIQVRSVTNCGARAVTLSRGGAAAMALPGDPVPAFAGERLVGAWAAQQILLPGERCPVGGDVAPREEDAPPPICLQFVVGCPPSSVCP